MVVAASIPRRPTPCRLPGHCRPIPNRTHNRDHILIRGRSHILRHRRGHTRSLIRGLGRIPIRCRPRHRHHHRRQMTGITPGLRPP
ncbi:hypothetical protein GCM10009091_05200 [Pseudomonas brenneri]|nr:hypothetical protein GCM10009091_05200 [Pseudomonas brenneri]